MAQSVGQVALDIVMGKNTVSSTVKNAMNDVKNTFNDSSATIATKAQSIGSACTQAGAALLPISAAAAGVAIGTAKMAVDYESACAKVKTIAGDTAAVYKGRTMDMGDAMKQLSTDTGRSAGEVAEATYSAISAGVDASKSVEFVATSSALAMGGFTDMGTAVDVLTTTINAYGLEADDAAMISDRLITTQNLGKTTVGELSASMGKVIPAASAYGVSLDNLSSTYVALTKGGISTAESTTYIKGMLNELGDSGSQVGQILQQQTGQSFTQLMQSGASLGDVMGILGASVDNDTAAFGQLWGSQEAGMGAMALLNGGVGEFNATMDAMANSTGAAQKAADTMADTAEVKLQKGINAAKNVGIELGGAIMDVLTPALEAAVPLLQSVAQFFGALPDPIKQVIGVIVLVIAVAAPLLLIIGNVISVVGTLSAAIPVIATAFGGVIAFITGTVVPALTGFITFLFGGVITFITGTLIPALGAFFAFLVANPVVLVIAAIVAGIVLLIANWQTVSQVAQQCWQAICDAVSAAGAWIANTWNGLCESASNTWNTITTNAGAAWEGFKNGVTQKASEIASNVSSKWNELNANASGAWQSLSANASSTWNSIKTNVGNAAMGMKDSAVSKFNELRSNAGSALGNLSSTASGKFNEIRNNAANGAENARTSMVNGFNNMVGGVSGAMGNVIGAVQGGLNNAVGFIRGVIGNAWSWGAEMIGGFATGISGAMGNVISAVQGGLNNAISFIQGLISNAWSWGADMISGFAEGVRGAMGDLIATVSGMAEEVRSYLHFSTPDTGPLADYETWMPDFVKGMAAGIDSNKYRLIDAVQDMTDEMTVNPSMAIDAPPLKTAPARIQTPVAENEITAAGGSKLYGMLENLIENMGDGVGDITVPVYIGNDIVDELIVRANDRRLLRSGGRA